MRPAFSVPLARWLHDRMPQTLFGRTLLIIVIPVLLLQIALKWIIKPTRQLALEVAGAPSSDAS